MQRIRQDEAKRYKNGCCFLNAKSVVNQVNVPKEVKTYCPRCKKHQAHSVTLYKVGKARPMAIGARRHSREKKGYGGQSYPLQKEFAKTTKKQTLKLKCKTCGYMRHKDGIRLRKLVIA